MSAGTAEWIQELSEAEFQSAVERFASLQGWAWMHVLRAQNPRMQWRTPTTGPLGSGWPDLVLVRGSRIIFAELKSNRGAVTELQRGVMATLDRLPFAEVYVWRPSQMAELMEILA